MRKLTDERLAEIAAWAARVDDDDFHLPSRPTGQRISIQGVKMRSGLAETYVNKLYDNPGNTTNRYWIHDQIMIGGSIIDAADFVHLCDDFAITDIINVETEHSDVGKVPSRHLCQAQVPDNGDPFPPEIVHQVIEFAKLRLQEDPKCIFHIHCQMGSSRSPAFGYALLRFVFEHNPFSAIHLISKGKGRDYGNHGYHRRYLDSIEAAMT